MDIGPIEVIIVLLVILLLFGPGRIAKAGGEVGKAIHDFRSGLKGDEGTKASAGKEKGSAPEELPEPMKMTQPEMPSEPEKQPESLADHAAENPGSLPQ